ncbi:DNA repair protein RadA/Sms [Scopulibacillus darangshiensis]|uniref:DNA repair protein RadA n=1 Tax=Scopulibacillus darangshiensis TaxID=442528 RepID=A0A4R2NRZ9_9BACL|nr:DNA repair protein RadA [Scopulibacillus darangshiensis]TCP24135.1 DNA repair protein RadA/Sms [Scopulibacillus darangshiensis]
MAKQKTVFFCQECGYESPKWMGKCPGCNQWNTMVEEKVSKVQSGGKTVKKKANKATPINCIESEKEPRVLTKMNELNRVLGGGVVPGSLVLVGGDPGIGKSTLLLQTSDQLASLGKKVLYISGEESIKQTKMRAERLGILSDNLYVLAETDIHEIEERMRDVSPDFLVIDSIQTVYNTDVASAPGSVAQVRECTGQLMRIAKSEGVATFIVGHVTKDGAIAGPRLLEHMVDAVLYFEGERHHTFRILRAVKNRFGSTNEMGVFEMKESGLVEVANPSEVFLQERTNGAAGSTVVAAMEGTRPVLVEIQALISPTSFGNPRRMATGLDHHRISLLMAVLEKRVGLLLQNQDAYINVAGGIRLDEPATDLAVAISIASSFRDQLTQPADVFIGEVGLTGEVRRVSRIEQRVFEASKLGFKKAYIPEKSLDGWTFPKGMEVIGVSSVKEAMDYALGGATHETKTAIYQSDT